MKSRHWYHAGISPKQSRNSHFVWQSENSYFARVDSGPDHVQCRNRDKKESILILIMKTCPCNVYPLKRHFYIAILGYAGVYLFLAHLSRRLTGELIVYPCSGVRPSSSVRRPSSTISKIFSSETAWPIKAKLHVEHP